MNKIDNIDTYAMAPYKGIKWSHGVPTKNRPELAHVEQIQASSEHQHLHVEQNFLVYIPVS